MNDFVKGDPPPWVEEDLAKPITRAEFNALNVKMAQLSTEVSRLQAIVASGRPAIPSTSDVDYGVLPRGKYAGKTHDSIVELDPWYIQWLHQEDKASGLGFTEEQVQEALDDPRPDPKARGRR